MNNNIELLAPAGDLERLKIAFAYGADAVYMAGKNLGMRAKAKNFDYLEMEEGIAHAHKLGKKVYITANIFAHNEDFDGMEEYFLQLQKLGADAIIISDLGVFSVARQVIPNMDIHISTQMNNTNFAAVNFWQQLGATRVVLARELSIEEISQIKKNVKNMELEAFVHGSMCMAYSGRCLLSNYLSQRDANRGECSQPCRWCYELVEKKSGEALPIVEDERGSYILNSKDMCLIRHLPRIINAGITSLKIEGRMKTSYYVGAVVKAYRQALDDYFKDEELYNSKLDYYFDQLRKVSHRDYTTGFFFGKMKENDHNYSGNDHTKTYDFVALILEEDENGFCQIEQRNKFIVGDTIEIIRAQGENFTQTVETILNEKGEEVLEAPHPQQKLRLKINAPVSKYDMVRKAISE